MSTVPSAVALLRNMRVYQNQRIDARPGMVKLANGPFVSPSALVHSIRRLNITNSFLRLLGVNTFLYEQVSGDNLASGFSGNPLSMVPFRPEQSPESWMYIADSNKMVKVGPELQVENIGIAPPLDPPVPLAGPSSFQIIDKFDSLTGWMLTGTGTGLILSNAIATTATAVICPDKNPLPNGFADNMGIIPAGFLNTFIPGLLIKAYDVANPAILQFAPVEANFPGGAPADTTTAIDYAAGTTGFCLANIGISTNTYVYSQIALIAEGPVHEYVSIQTVNVDGGGNIVLGFITVNPYTAGATITQVGSFEMWGDKNINAMLAGTMELTAPMILATNCTVGNVIFTKTEQLNLSVTDIFGDRAIQDSTDSITLAVYVSDYTDFSFGLIFYLDTDVSVNDFTQNYYFTDLLVPSQNGINVFTVAISALHKFGTGPGTLANVGAIRVNFGCSGGTPACGLASWWIGGPYGGTGSPTGYTYFYRGRSSVTGATSNASPGQRVATTQMSAGEVVNMEIPPDPQIDTLDVFRQGGTSAFQLLLGSVTVVGGSGGYAPFYDVLTDTNIASQPVLETDNFQPFPTIDLPKSGVVNVSGTTVTWVSGDKFDTRWAPGSLITINGEVYSLYQQPQSATSLQLFENAGTQTGVAYSISGQTLLGVPVPYLWGPFAQGTASYLFACGDSFQPGVLFLTNGNNPDSASDTLQIEITPPSEPLMNGVMYNGESYVWSSDRVFQLYPNFGQSLIVQNNQVLPASTTSLFVPLEIPNGKGLFGNWNVAVGPKMWYRARDGIYETTGGQPNPITVGDWALLFPHEGQPGEPVQAGPVTVYPPDDMQPQFQRLSFYDSNLYWDYKDTQGNLRTLVFDTINGTWSVDDYTPGVLIHYGEEGRNVHSILMGAKDGNVYQMLGGTDGGGQAIPCAACIPTLSEDVGGFQTIRMAYLGLSATSPVTLAILMDMASGSVQINATSAYQRLFTNLPPLKGRLQQWSLSSPAPFALMQRDGEFYVRAWGAQGTFRKINPFGIFQKAQTPKLT